jgi:hypothetical protein
MNDILGPLLTIARPSSLTSVPSVVSCKPKTPLNKEFVVVDFAITTNYLPYVGVMRALAILWCMVLMSFYNMYVYYLAAFSGDFGSYILIAIYKVFSYFMGLSAKRSRKISENHVFIFAMLANCVLDISLLGYDFSLQQFPPYFQFFSLGLDVYITVVAFNLRGVLNEYHQAKHEKKSGSHVLAAATDATQKLNITKVNHKSRTHYARKLLKAYGRYGSFLISSLVLWVFFDLMGMTLTTIVAGPNPQTPLFFNAFLHFAIIPVGLYGFYRRLYKCKVAFSALMIPLLILDLIAMCNEINQAYVTGFLPFNYVVIVIIDTYILSASIKYALSIHRYHEAVKHFKEQGAMHTSATNPNENVKFVVNRGFSDIV